MNRLTQHPLGRPLPRPRDHSARDGGALVPRSAIPRDLLVLPGPWRVTAPARPTLPHTPYDDPAHLLALAMRDREARRGRCIALLLTALLAYVAYWWL